MFAKQLKLPRRVAGYIIPTQSVSEGQVACRIVNPNF